MASSGSLPASFRQMREAGEMVDVCLVFGDKRVPCHKVVLAGTCEYFKRMFLTNEQVSKRVIVRGINARTGILIVDYLYAGHLEITAENVQDLLQASDLFSLSDLKQNVESYLCDQLGAGNAISFLNLGRVFRLKELSKYAHKLLTVHFNDVMDGGEMHQLRKEDLVQLITAHEIPENRFRLLQKWSMSAKGRSGSFMEMLKHVGLSQCSKAFITSTVMSEKLMASTQGLQLIQQAMQCPLHQSLVVGDSDGKMWMCSDEQTWQHMQKPPAQSSVYSACASPKGFIISGGYSDPDVYCGDCFSYDSHEKIWEALPPMTTGRCNHGSVYHVDALFVAGGRDSKAYLKSVERFEVRTRQWSRLPSLPKALLCPSVVSASNRLFVLGGWHGGSYSGGNCEFDSTQKAWMSRTPMPTECGCASAVAFNGHIYVVCGSNYKNLRYDIRQDSWVDIQQPKFNHRLAPCLLWNEKILVLGDDGDDGEDRVVEVLDPQPNQWSTSQLRLPSRGPLRFAIII